MKTVLLYGDPRDDGLTGTLFGALRGAGQSTLAVGEDTVSLVPPGAAAPDFLLLERDRVPELHMGGGVLVVKQRLPAQAGRALSVRLPFSAGKERRLPGGFSAVVDSSGAEAVRMLETSGLQTVTCGMSLRDTLTFSSLEAGAAVVSLQRALSALDGSAVEPRELPVRFSPGREPYAILASVAVLLLCGRMPEAELDIL